MTGSSFVRQPMLSILSPAAIAEANRLQNLPITAAAAAPNAAVPTSEEVEDRPHHRGWGNRITRYLVGKAKKRRDKAQKAGRKANSRKGRHGKAHR